MLETYRDENDARVLYYRLTDIGKPIALEHQHHHQHTLHTYEGCFVRSLLRMSKGSFRGFRFIGRGVIV